mmetsp:Transcript_31085/g.53541  ORF Transcript_31085/g.53541 Transcript_31085/m.53541 type:complete len:120 (+) Transcript_31085:111-470(+)
MCPKLTLKQRLSGFLGLTAFGYLLTILATLTISEGYDEENMQRFCGFYIVGNFIAIFATGLWVGPKKLCKKMFKKKRRIGTVVWFSLMIAVFTTAMLKGPLGLVLGMMAAEVRSTSLLR